VLAVRDNRISAPAARTPLTTAEPAVADVTAAWVISRDSVRTTSTLVPPRRRFVGHSSRPTGWMGDITRISDSCSCEDVNLRAPMLMTQQLLPGMLHRRRGHLVYISSIAGKVTSPRAPIYSATKVGLRGFCGSLRRIFTDLW